MYLNINLDLESQLNLTMPKRSPYPNIINQISGILYPHKRLILVLFVILQIFYHVSTPVNTAGLSSDDKLALTRLETYQGAKEQIISRHLKDTFTLNYSDTSMFLIEAKTTFIAFYQWTNLVMIKNKIRYFPKDLAILKEEIETYRSSDLFGISKHYADNLSNKKNQQFSAAWQNLKKAKVIDAWSSFSSGFDLLVLENQTLIDPSMELKLQTIEPGAPSPEELDKYYALLTDLRKKKSNTSKKYYSYKKDTLRRASAYGTNRSSLSRITKVLQWKEQILAASNKYQIDPAIVAALIEQESGGNPDALSSAGAIGLMQLMPGTARGLGVNPFDPTENIDGGTKYFSLQLKRFGNVTDAMVAYNAGPARVGRLLPEETQKYIVNVPALIDKYRPYFV